MANYSNLKTAIENAVDWNNGDNEITGQNLLDILETIIDSLGAKYKFADVATPSSSITTPDEPLFYLAGAGTYTNFSGLSVTIPRGTLSIFYYDTAWHYTTVRTDSDAFFNVNQHQGTPSTTYTKANARNAVPEALRSKGMIITYLTTNGWIIEQNLSTSGTWNADANWQTIGPVSVSQNTLSIGSKSVLNILAPETIARENKINVPLCWESGTLDNQGQEIPREDEERTWFIDSAILNGATIYINDSVQYWINYFGESDSEYYGFEGITGDIVNFQTVYPRVRIVAKVNRHNMSIENKSIFAQESKIDNLLTVGPSDYTGDAPSLPIESGFFPVDSFQTLIRNKKIRGVRINVSTIGTITIVKGVGVGTITPSQFTPTIIQTFNAKITGIQDLIFTTPIILADNEFLGIAQDTDTGRFKYSHEYTLDEQRYYWSVYSTVWALSSGTLGLGVIIDDYKIVEETEKAKEQIEQNTNKIQTNTNVLNGKIVPFSFYNKPNNYTAIKIDTVNGKVIWETAYFILYSTPISDEHTIQGGETNFIGDSVDKNYSYYIFYNKTDKTFEAVRYDAINTYLQNDDEVFLIAQGSLNNPQSTLFIGGPLNVDDEIILPNALPNPTNKLKGKKFSIIGDSISTYAGYLVSSKEGYVGSNYAAWYPRGNVDDVSKTWWKRLEKLTGMQLLNNCAWSGSQVTGNSESTTSAYYGCSNKRISDVAFGGTNPDIIIVYMGINDFGQNSTGVKPLGDWIGESEIPAEGDQTYFSNAFGLMLYKLQDTYKTSKIFVCSLLETGQAGYDYVDATKFPAININGDTLHKWNTRIKTICGALGVPLIDLHCCGINYANLETYTVDRLHPNSAGHELMAKYIMDSLIKEY